MNQKLIYAAMLTCIALVTQVERFRTVRWAKSRQYHPHELGFYQPCSVWMTMDNQAIVIGDDHYDILHREKMDADSVQSYDCVFNKRRCKLIMDRKKGPGYDAQCWIFYGEDSTRAYTMFRDY